MHKFLFFLFSFLLLGSCQPDIVQQNPHKAKELFDEGMKITSVRIAVQDLTKARELNKKAIEKFSASYELDTSFKDAALFASECTMFAKDYQNCLIWTARLMRIDTSKSNVSFCMDRIQYCNKQIQKLQKK